MLDRVIHMRRLIRRKTQAPAVAGAIIAAVAGLSLAGATPPIAHEPVLFEGRYGADAVLTIAPQLAISTQAELIVD